MKINDKVFMSCDIEQIDPIALGVGKILSIDGDNVNVLWEHSGQSYTYNKKYLSLIQDQIRWVNCIDLLPKSDDRTEPCNQYYFIELDTGNCMMAMYMDNEWWQSYTCKVIVPVKRWIKQYNKC
jgi:hypothetical protein